MHLDVQTLIVLLLACLATVTLALPVIMGPRVSAAAHCMQGAVAAQALGWLSFFLAGRWHDRLLSTLCMALLGVSFLLLWQALRHWLGPRPGRWLLWMAAVLTPVGYWFGFHDYAFRVGWSNFGLALEMLIVCLALAWPAPGASWRWRALVLVGLAAMAIVTAWRGTMGAFFTADYPYYRAPHPVNLAAAVLNPVALFLTTIGLLIAWREEGERELRKHATTDALTGLMNRRTFEQRAIGYLSLALRHHDPLALMVIDLDHFKQINDREGHAGGDKALQRFASLLERTLRRGDIACRYGGEEFCVLLSRADAAAATAFDRRLRTVLDADGSKGGVALSYSAGVACVGPVETLDEVIARADAALYRAKAAGRRRLEVAGRD